MFKSLVTCFLAFDVASAWLSASPMLEVHGVVRQQGMSAQSLRMIKGDGNEDMIGDTALRIPVTERRQILESMAVVGMALWTSTALEPVQPSNALVKGNAPPPKKSAGGGDKPKCTNVEECQAMAEKREQELRESQEQGPPALVTSGGTRYRELEEGSGNEVKDGDEVQVFFKVLKLGKRSYDGISGEGTVVFSRGMFGSAC